MKAIYIIMFKCKFESAIKYAFVIIIMLFISTFLNIYAEEIESDIYTVYDAASFVDAIGGESAAWINEAGEVCLKKDIPLGKTIVISGGEIKINGAGCGFFRSFDGDSMFIINGGTVILGKSNNTDKDESLIFCGNSDNFRGNVFTVNSGRLEIYKGVLIEDCVSDNGGAIYISDGETIMAGGTVSECSAIYGGGIYIENGYFNMSDGQIKSCSADEKGGGIFQNGGQVEFFGGIIGGEVVYSSYSSVSDPTVRYENGNHAKSGGGIYFTNVENGIISACSITANTADFGGGIYTDTDTVLTLVSVDILYNSAKSGGGIYNSGSILSGYTQINYNSAQEKGGGIYNDNALFKMQDGSASNNSAAFGAGFFNYGKSSFEGTGGTVHYNQAQYYGGGAVNSEDSTIIILGTSIEHNRLSDSFIYGVEIYTVGNLILGESVFFGGNKDIALGIKSDGSSAYIELQPPFSCTTTIARLYPVTEKDGVLVEDYSTDRILLSYENTDGETDLADYVSLFKVLNDSTSGEWTISSSGKLVHNIPGSEFFTAAAIVILAISAGIVFVVKTTGSKKKKQ